MEEAAVHTADGLAAEPMLLAVVTIAVALIVAAVLIAREMRSGKEKQLEFEARSSEAQLNLQREVESTRLDLEEKREQRKIEASNRSTAAIEAMSRLMDTNNARLDMSQERSRVMGQQMQDVHATVHTIDNNVQEIADALFK